MPARSIARPMTPSSASISRTRWPLPSPPIAGLHDISPIVARRMRQQRRARPDPRRRRRRLAAGMPAADHDDVVECDAAPLSMWRANCSEYRRPRGVSTSSRITRPGGQPQPVDSRGARPDSIGLKGTRHRAGYLEQIDVGRRVPRRTRGRQYQRQIVKNSLRAMIPRARKLRAKENARAATPRQKSARQSRRHAGLPLRRTQSSPHAGRSRPAAARRLDDYSSAAIGALRQAGRDVESAATRPRLRGNALPQSRDSGIAAR